MNIIIAETLYPKGHKMLNSKFVECIAQNHNILLFENESYFNNKISNVRVKHIKQYKPKCLEIIFTIVYFINLLIIAWNARKEKYDRIIFLSTRIDSLFFTYRLFRKNSICVVHHNDIDRMLNRGYEKVIFKAYMNKIKHIVLADFIREGLIKETSINPKNVFVVHQPSIENLEINDLCLYNRNNLIIGLGQSMSQNFISELIKLDQENNIDYKYNIKIRSLGVKYLSENIEVDNKYLSREEFNHRLLSATACIIMYPSTFNLRYSGVIDDALNHGLIVYCNDIAVGRYFAEQYPHTCRILKDANHLVEIAQGNIPQVNTDEVLLFKDKHSVEYVINQWDKVIS